MKNRTVTLRLSELEYQKLENDSALVRMTASQYIRSLINRTAPASADKRQEALSKACQLYIILAELNLDKEEALMQGVGALCQTLS